MCLSVAAATQAVPDEATAPAAPPAVAPAAPEATERARLLHAALDGALRVMHRDFFRKGDSKAIPSESLQDVFRALETAHGVKLRWVATEETAQSDAHKPADDFQRRALEAFARGEKEAHTVEKGTLRFIGVIALENQCLKCHVPDRKSLHERYSGLEIAMPVRGAP